MFVGLKDETMADKDLSPTEMRARLWKALDKARVVKLDRVGGKGDVTP